jgi:hypothetical protein
MLALAGADPPRWGSKLGGDGFGLVDRFDRETRRPGCVPSLEKADGDGGEAPRFMCPPCTKHLQGLP